MRPIAAAACLALVFACAPPEAPDSPPPPPPEVVDYRWQTAADLPTPRTEVSAASMETMVFVAGGFLADGSVSDLVEVYDTAAGVWMEGPRLPEPLHHAGLAVVGARLFVVGGYRADNSASDELWSVAPFVTPPDGEMQPGTWQRETAMPTARGALAVAVVQGRIHAVGGASAFGARPVNVGAHEAYDPGSGEWEELPDLPDPRDHLAAAGANGDLVVAGGRHLSMANNLARLDVYDPRTRQWTQGADMPTARGGIAAAAVGERVFVFGGEEPGGTFPHVEVYDLTAGTWARAPDLPTPRHGLGAAVVGDLVYVVGGGPQPGLTVSSANEVLGPQG